MAKTNSVTTKDIGRYVRVGFIDTGASDGIITDVDGPTDFRFLPFSELKDGDIGNNAAPILALGHYITAEHSGLLS